jgi:LacI family xylobiose transport system transcriptional regulator
VEEEPVVPARARLARVADEAGVSISTVSKVLNGRSDVSPGTRSRVEALLDAHSYRRRGERSSSTYLELVFHEIESAWSTQIIQGVEAVARAHGMSVVLTLSGDHRSPGPEWVTGVLGRRPAGVVLVLSGLAEEQQRRLRAADIPFAIIDPSGDPAPDVPSVGSANWMGGVLATRHLLEEGHTRIGVITGPADMMCSRARLDGFRSAMGSAGVPVDESLIRFGDFHVPGGRDHALELLSSASPPTALFAGSDLQALGVLEAARMRGVRVPEDLSLVGYDDLPIAEWTSPPLTTVHQPLRLMGEEATRLVLRLRDGGTTQLRMDLATSLVVRGSTARV